MKLGMISLGCAKNQIDTELFLGVATKYNLELTNSLKEADIIVINTCGFIESAKKEAIDTLLNITENKKNKIVIAMGCLVERYLEDLKQAIPEVDIYFPIRDYDNIDSLFNKIINENKEYKMDYQNRYITTLPHSAYLRISEGCNNKCSYCAIPLIRGPFRSRTLESLIDEAKTLANKGVKEITLIGQDTSRYGTDLNKGYDLADLLHEVSKINEFEIIRVLYLYPDEITDRIINEIKNNPKICKYFDIPIQHSSNKMLKAMNRRGSREFLISLFNKIKTNIPEAIIRTTLIVGFPSEDIEDFNDLYAFVNDNKFNRLGIFTYSDEEDTKGFDMYPKVDEKIMKARLDKLMKLQATISLENNKSYIGKIFKAIVDLYDYNKNAYLVRNYAYAPDDVDGYIYMYQQFDNKIKSGDIINIEIIEANEYDLYAKKI